MEARTGTDWSRSGGSVVSRRGPQSRSKMVLCKQIELLVGIFSKQSRVLGGDRYMYRF